MRISVLPESGLSPLSEGDMVSLGGGGTLSGGLLGELVKHVGIRLADCMIDSWSSLVDCFNEGRAAASR